MGLIGWGGDGFAADGADAAPILGGIAMMMPGVTPG